jgi:hypothetical protein
MPHVHDRGGWHDPSPIERTEHQFAQWEDHTHTFLELLIGPKNRFNLDEFRRAIEGIEGEKYESMTYYERWLTAIETCLIQKGVLTQEEIDEKVAQLSHPDHPHP